MSLDVDYAMRRMRELTGKPAPVASAPNGAQGEGKLRTNNFDDDGIGAAKKRSVEKKKNFQPPSMFDAPAAPREPSAASARRAPDTSADSFSFSGPLKEREQAAVAAANARVHRTVPPPVHQPAPAAASIFDEFGDASFGLNGSGARSPNDSFNVVPDSSVASGSHASRVSASQAAVPHASIAVAAAAKAKKQKEEQEPRRYLSMRELTRRNFQRDFGINIRIEDEIDLEHTSCSEEEHNYKRWAGDQVEEIDSEQDEDAVRPDDIGEPDARADGDRRFSLSAEFGDDYDDDDDDDILNNGEEDEQARRERRNLHTVKERAASFFAAKKRAFDRARRGSSSGSGAKRKAEAPAPSVPKAAAPASAKRQRTSESDTSGISLGSENTSRDSDDDEGESEESHKHAHTSPPRSSSSEKRRNAHRHQHPHSESGALVPAAAGAVGEERRLHGDCAQTASTLGRMTGCFLCLYGDQEYDSVNNEDMAHLLRLLNENIGKIDPMAIALIMHRYYTDTMRNKAQTRGQYLPPWRSKSIFICIETHNLKPEIQIARNMWDVQVLVNCLKNRIVSVRRDLSLAQLAAADDGEELNQKNLSEYSKLLKTWAWLSNMRPEKMTFYNPNQKTDLGDPRVYARGVELRTDRSVATNKLAHQRLLKAR